MIESHVATSQQNPLRLQEYGVGIFTTIPTKSALKKALRKKLIFVDGAIATTATFIKGGEHIEYHKPENNPSVDRLKLSLDVVYEDDYIAVINKPAGLLVSGNCFKTVANALAQNLTNSNAEDSTRFQPVHRLDYLTTGLLLVGKTSKSILSLNSQFQQQNIEKIYYAVSIGKMDVHGIVNSPVDGKEAISRYTVISSIKSKRFEFLNFVKLQPITGRRHQLRKHLFSMGNPILGDPNYFLPDLILKGKGIYLHAQAITFLHPATCNVLTIASKLPLKFHKLFKHIS